MRIVLPGALPDPREARELTTYLASTAPTLLGWLQRGRATATPADPADAGCTPLEQWQLAVCGFQPQTGQNLAAGLGPLLAADATEPNQPVWLARSEEHTSELQSLMRISYAVFCLKKKKKQQPYN